MTPRRDDSATVQVGDELSYTAGAPSVTSVSTGERLDITANPLCHARYTSTLTFLSNSVRLRRPVLVSIREWSDGIVEAHLADALLYGTGDDEAEALEDLRDNIVDAWDRLSALQESSMAKPAWRIWSALRELCEPSGRS